MASEQLTADGSAQPLTVTSYTFDALLADEQATLPCPAITPDRRCPHDLRDREHLVEQVCGVGKFRRIDHAGPSASLPLPAATARTRAARSIA